MATNSELKAKVDTAIASVLEGKSVSYNGRTITMENLDVLYAIRNDLARKITVEANPNKSRNRAKVRFI